MNLLLDSNAFLWLLFAPGSIGDGARLAIESATEVRVSVVTLWELTLKASKGKLPHHPDELVRGVEALGARELAIEHRHLLMLPGIELPHGDPFDALLIAQAHADDLVLLTADRVLLASDDTTMNVRF